MVSGLLAVIKIDLPLMLPKECVGNVLRQGQVKKPTNHEPVCEKRKKEKLFLDLAARTYHNRQKTLRKST